LSKLKSAAHGANEERKQRGTMNILFKGTKVAPYAEDVHTGGNDVTRSSSSHIGSMLEPRGYLAVKSALPFQAEMTSQDRHPLLGSMLEPRGYL
jgi:hypothetical protein